MRNTSMIRSAALLLVLVGCGGTPAAFGTKYPDNRDSDVELLLQRLDAASERPAGTIAVAISSAPAQLYAYDLASRRLLWQRRVDAASVPYQTAILALQRAGGNHPNKL